MQVKSKSEAQQRVDQIGYFQAELEIIEQEKIVSLHESQRSAIADYHENLITQLASTFDIDSNTREKQLSLGMKIASFLGAFGLAASVFFLFYQFWGRFSTNVQVFILISAPLVGLAATMYASHREKTGRKSLIPEMFFSRFSFIQSFTTGGGIGCRNIFSFWSLASQPY